MNKISRLFAYRAYLLRREARYVIAELMFLSGNVLPASLALYCWRAALTLNPHHVAAALNRAHGMRKRQDLRAWEAFHDAVRAIRNPQRTSASDLALTWVPGQLVRRIAHRVLWGYAPQDYLTEINDRWRRDALVELAQALFAESVAQKNWERAAEAFDIWANTAGETLAVQWGRVELAWGEGKWNELREHALPLIARGRFVSPLDALMWAERFCREATPETWSLAATCLDWAKQWTPERAALWRLQAEIENVRGEKERARFYLERAASLNSEDIAIFFARQNLERPTSFHESLTAHLRVHVTDSLELEAQAVVECSLEPASSEWMVYALPPRGWGLVAEPRVQPFDAQGRCPFVLRACRPDRVRGEAWTITFVAVGAHEYALARATVRVPDRTPGRLLVLVTEDHELHEERATITREDVERLLVNKSKFAAEQFAPWTHMVEVGSTLALLDWAAEQDDSWMQTRTAVRAHLVQQIKAGNDIQPHLHTFNLPDSPNFPYRLTPEGILPRNDFLLTAEERRGSFASGLTPDERFAAVGNAVAQIERLAHAADPNYRAVLWRSGQLELGEDTVDRAWSSAALLRAGILADSDLGNASMPSSALAIAFFADMQEPFTPQFGGDLLQLPIANNLEGNFLTDAHALTEFARRTTRTLRDETGAFQPGIHLITLLTHDKFMNARRGGDEFRLDPQYNEWVTMRAHLEAWRAAGAERVTAQQGIFALLDDGAWHLRAWLCGAMRTSASCIRYTIELVGKGIPISPQYPQSVRVTIPSFLREEVRGIRVVQGESVLPIERTTPHDFWLVVSSRTPTLYCEFELNIERNG
ncbi:MAG TPA: hypothetical protein VFD70_19830 [Anaerolineae bacterium]|nr:hypothetical protein [Anaerolineae bacterium]